MHSAGCDETDADLEQTMRTLAGIGKNPNVAASLVIGLGCEVLPPFELMEEIRKEGKPVACLIIQREGGTIKTIQKGIALAQEMVGDASKIQKELFDASFLSLGTQCGGSDATSGLAANPALGFASDKLVELGGVSIIAETPELIGAEHWLTKRAISREVADHINFVVKRYEERLKAIGEDFVGKQPCPGNIEGGLSTIEEKSLGCVTKVGRAPIQGVLEYGEVPSGKGVYIMDTPGSDIESDTALLAGGCQMICFTTGCGTPVGTPIAPVIKITGNPYTFERMKDNTDINAGTIVIGKEFVKDVGQKIFEEMIAVASGKQTKSEILGCQEFSINRLELSY
jgi:altronate dehydratase large subunit